MATNLATALFGLADTWAIGRLGDSPAQGAVDIGARCLTAALVVFNFLRTGTTALTARASGRSDQAESGATLVRALMLAAGIGVILLMLLLAFAVQAPLWLGAQGRVAELAGHYIAVRSWAVPAALANMALTGWLVGQRQVRAVLGAEVLANVLHIALDLTLVLGLHWGVRGVATASLVSELAKFALLAAMAWRAWHAHDLQHAAVLRHIRSPGAFRALTRMNGDLLLRTLLLTGAILTFTHASAQGGIAVLAANGILMQWFMAATLLLDGFETAAQVLCAEAFGASNPQRFAQALRATLGWAAITALALGAIEGLAGTRLIAAFTLDPAVRAAAKDVLPWALALPLAGCASFVLDGGFVGAGWTRGLLVTMLAAFGVFQVALWCGSNWGNHGLWLAYTLFLLARAGAQAIWLRARASIPEPPAPVIG